MSKLRIFMTSVFTIALATGIWAMAVTFTNTASSFSDGDVLQAADLNSLFSDINTNFQDAQTAINNNDSAISGNDTDISNLQSDKADVAGDDFTGRVDISADASSSGSGDPTTTFRVNNTDTSSGSAAVFQSNNSSDNGAVSIKQDGAGAALSLKSNGGGPLITGAGSLEVNFVVEDDGSIKIGNMGTDGAGDPTLHLDAANGTITNDVGSGLPVAFGTVASDGSYDSGTTNWTANWTGTRYEISITGENYFYTDYTTVVTPYGGAIGADTGSGSDDLFVYLKDDQGNNVQGGFQFVTYKNP